MKESYNIYCVSNASIKNNDLTCFKNFLPQNLDLKNKEWEIGIVKFGFQFNTEKIENASMVSISTDVVIDSPNGNKYSTLVYDTSLLTSSKDKYFNHYVKNIKYFPIRNTFINTITTKFVDINGKKLLIEKGQPSFIHFHLKTRDLKNNLKMNYIRLDSETTKMEQANNNNNFWVHLQDSMELDKNSEVALVNINYPNCIRNINTSLSKKAIEILIKHGEDFDQYYLNIPAAYYSSASNLIEALRSILPTKVKKLIKFSNLNGKFKIESLHKEQVAIKFPIAFNNIFGFNTEISNRVLIVENNVFYVYLQKKSSYIATNPINVMYDYPSVMLCHANFVKHSIVGNSYSPILKIIPTETPSKDDYISVHFDHFEFIKTNVEYLKDLHFELRRLNGDFIEFDNNKKIILNLVVKKM